MDGFEIEGVSQHEGELGLLTGIGQPIPAEHAFAADCEVVAIGLDQLEEVSEVVVFDVGMDELLALAIHDADVHLASVQVDSAVELGGGCVVVHRCVIDWCCKVPVNVYNAGKW